MLQGWRLGNIVRSGHTRMHIEDNIQLNDIVTDNYNSVLFSKTSCPNNQTTDIPLLSSPLRYLSLFLILLSVAGFAGNVMAIIAIWKIKKLMSNTNLVLSSLATADLLVSLLVMPTGIMQLTCGCWPLGDIACSLYIFLDVCLCTSSIMHMCCVSIDRYLGIAYPLKFRQFRTRRATWWKISLVWLLSILIACPVFIHARYDRQQIYAGGYCGMNSISFQIYGSMCAFFIPLSVMTLTYSLTIQILNKQTLVSNQRTSIYRASPRTTYSRQQSLLEEKLETADQYDPVERGSLVMRSPVSLDDITEVQSPAHDTNSPEELPYRSTDSPSIQRLFSNDNSIKKHPTHSFCFPNRRYLGKSYTTDNCRQPHSRDTSPQTSRGMHSDAYNHDGLNRLISQEFSQQTLNRSCCWDVVEVPIITNRYRTIENRKKLIGQKLSREGYTAPNNFKRSESIQSHISRQSEQSGQGSRMQLKGSIITFSESGPSVRNKLRDLYMNKKRSVSAFLFQSKKKGAMGSETEKKAMKVLGIVFVVFVGMWAPFFIVNVVSAICKSCPITEVLVNIVLWLGYSASIVNPIIYTIFNKQFRKAFRDIVTCRLWRKSTGKTLQKCVKNVNKNLMTIPAVLSGTTGLPHQPTSSSEDSR